MPAEERDLLPPPPAAAGGFLLAVIFANGDLNPPPDLSPRLAAASLTLAAAGGGPPHPHLGCRRRPPALPRPWRAPARGHRRPGFSGSRAAGRAGEPGCPDNQP